MRTITGPTRRVTPRSPLGEEGTRAVGTGTKGTSVLRDIPCPGSRGGTPAECRRLSPLGGENGACVGVVLQVFRRLFIFLFT